MISYMYVDNEKEFIINFCNKEDFAQFDEFINYILLQKEKEVSERLETSSKCFT